MSNNICYSRNFLFIRHLLSLLIISLLSNFANITAHQPPKLNNKPHITIPENLKFQILESIKEAYEQGLEPDKIIEKIENILQPEKEHSTWLIPMIWLSIGCIGTIGINYIIKSLTQSPQVPTLPTEPQAAPFPVLPDAANVPDPVAQGFENIALIAGSQNYTDNLRTAAFSLTAPWINPNLNLLNDHELQEFVAIIERNLFGANQNFHLDNVREEWNRRPTLARW